MARNQIHFDLKDEEYTAFTVIADKMGWSRSRLAAEIARNFLAMDEESAVNFLTTDVTKRIKKAKRHP